VLVLATLVGCTSSSPPADTEGPVTLTVVPVNKNTEITGAGIECGTDPACDGTLATTCSVTLTSGTRVSLAVRHPVCPGTPSYTSFGWTSPPCPVFLSYSCDFVITEDEVIRVTGGTTAQ
jgi:hypothetical protein